MSKSLLSRTVRSFREGLKQVCQKGSAKLLRRRSYPIFGVPSGITAGEGIKKTIYPCFPLSLTPPKSIDKILYPLFEGMLKGMAIPEQGILAFEGATATQLGGNLSREGKLITTFLQVIDGKPPHRHDLFHFSTKRFFPRIYRAQGPVATLAAGWQGAFYHWMFEVLPRFHLIEKAELEKQPMFYIESNFLFQKESLELLGIEPHQMINAKEYAAVFAPRLLVPSISEIPPVWSCNFLREKICPKLDKRASIRLYVSRNDASRRRIINEEAVFGLLKQKGFEKVELSKLSFKEQAELFFSAEAVVGPHGAGFSHLVFCSPSTPVLEIFSPSYINPCYWHVSDRVGLEYYYLFGEGEHLPTGHSFIDPDIEVDLKKLEASLTLMGL